MVVRYILFFLFLSPSLVNSFCGFFAASFATASGFNAKDAQLPQRTVAAALATHQHHWTIPTGRKTNKKEKKKKERSS